MSAIKLLLLGLLIIAVESCLASNSEGAAPAVAICSSGFLRVDFDKATGTFGVEDVRNGRKWEPALLPKSMTVHGVERRAGGLMADLSDSTTGQRVRATLEIEDGQPELVVTLEAEGPMSENLAYPSGFRTRAGEHLILPFNQGITYPTDDLTIAPRDFMLFAGANGLCMPWYGVTTGAAGWMAIVESADDALVEMVRREGLLELQPVWCPQKGFFGYARVIRFVFFDQGGHVAMAKRYRRFAQDKGLVKTLEEKRTRRPLVDLLVGAPLVWFQSVGGGSASGIYRDMKSLGMDRVFWHSGGTPEELAELDSMGALTGCYDIYQDAMNPMHFPRLKHINARWVTEAWENDDIILDKDGSSYTSWPVKAIDGERIFCGVVCDARIPGYAKKRIPAELQEKPLRGRMIDTAAAAPWRECHHPDHPMTRSDSKRHRMDLLRYVGDELGLVSGTESGHAEAVPFIDFFDGMMSFATYRVPNSGHVPFEIWHEVPEVVSKFQTGHYYRLPLWELVFHDCAVSYWYWGDFNNKLPTLWDRRDLINALYATPPVWGFDAKNWEEQKDHFAKSYATTVPVARAAGFSEMVSHEWLVPDRSVQRTRFANGVTVTVNFGDTLYEPSDNDPIPPLDLRVEGLPRD